jgi:predicted metal-dependent peptidase
MSLEKYMGMQLKQVEQKNKELKARFTRTANIDLMNQWKQKSIARNYQTEYDRIRNYIAVNSVVAGYTAPDPLIDRSQQLRRLGAQAVSGIRD